uniref:Uncharacterized protein n=1 Tax=Romanomermis culicivorax TaxID=13658 RepID=A0A915HWN7_ROMCU
MLKSNFHCEYFGSALFIKKGGSTLRLLFCAKGGSKVSHAFLCERRPPPSFFVITGLVYIFDVVENPADNLLGFWDAAALVFRLKLKCLVDDVALDVEDGKFVDAQIVWTTFLFTKAASLGNKLGFAGCFLT